MNTPQEQEQEHESPIILVDTREKTPYTFKGMRIDRQPVDVQIQTKTLKTGDYTVLGLEDRLCVERKSITDFYHTVFQERDRFIKELERMKAFDSAAVVVEGKLESVLMPSTHGRKCTPESVLGTITSFFARYHVCFFFCSGRFWAEKCTWKLLTHCWKELKDGPR